MEELNNKNPLVYIVMPCYNGEKYLLEQLMSIYYQNYTNRYLIFVNDGSTDNSENILRDWISHYNLHDKVMVINKENGGVNSAVQRWLEEIKNMCDIHNTDNLIAYCDADDAWTRNKLEIQVEYMLNHPECDLSYHDLTKIDENWKVIQMSRMKSFYPKRDKDYLLYIWNYITSTAMMFKQKYIDYIIPMPTWFMIYQDYWTALVLWINSCKIDYINHVLWYYRTGHASLIKKASKENEEKRNKSKMKYFYSLKEKFPKMDFTCIIDYNEDVLINWNKTRYSTIYILTKYPKIFYLKLKIKFWELFKLVKHLISF